MKELVTVIIPVYNSSKYIEECLKSVINQTYKNIEVIVINDGSTDDSDVIIKKIQERNKNIIYIKQENKGVGITRNTGITIAKGDYIVFIDSDDKIKEEYIETLINSIEDNKKDVIYSGVNYFNNLPLCNSLYQYIILGPVAKIYRKEFLIKNEIKFLDAKFAEDAYFNLQALLKANSIKVIDYTGYFYRKNEQGITNNIRKNSIDINIEKILKDLYKVWENNKSSNEDKKYYIELYFFICIGFGYLKELCKNLSFHDFKIEYDKIIKFFNKNNIIYRKNNLLNFRNIFKEDYKNRIILKVFFILDKLKVGKICLWIYNKLVK